jgi:hypothetical protein
LKRLMDIVSISEVTKKSLGLISEVTKVVRVSVPSRRAMRRKDQERVALMVSDQ